MREKIQSAWQYSKPLLVVFLVIGGSLWGIYWIASVTWEALEKIDEKFAVTLVMAVIVASGSILGILVSKHLDRKHKVEADLRDKKIQFYQKFIKQALAGFFGADKTSSGRKRSRSDDQLVDFLREWKGELIVWGGPAVISSYIKMEAGLRTGGSGGNLLLNTSQLICDVLLAIRTDLGLSNRGLDRDTFMRFVSRYPELIEVLKANPSMTLEELNQLEKKIETDRLA